MSSEIYTGHTYTGSFFSLTSIFRHFLPSYHRTYWQSLNGLTLIRYMNHYIKYVMSLYNNDQHTKQYYNVHAHALKGGVTRESTALENGQGRSSRGA